MSRSPSRQNEVLKILAKYGVMDTNALNELLVKKLKGSWKRELFTTLKNKKLIVSGTSLIGGSPTQYWMLPDEADVYERVAARTGLKSSEFRTKRCHWSQYPHESLCTLFQASIERQMQSVRILREATNNFADLPQHLLSEQVKENGYAPDLCLGIPTSGNAEAQLDGAHRWVAVEIDRSVRSKKRVSERANIYSRHTAFDGVLYLVADQNSLENLRGIYVDQGAKNSLRITGCSNSFLASALVPKTLFDVNSLNVYCDTREISLNSWLALIAMTKSHKRDEMLLRISDLTPETDS